MPTASASDVRVEIDTKLSDVEIEGDSTTEGILDVVERDIDREYDSAVFEDSQHRQDFEAVLGALRIATGRDRRADAVSSGRTSTEYETSAVAGLRSRVRRLDPGSEFGHPSSVIRTDRHVSSTTDLEER